MLSNINYINVVISISTPTEVDYEWNYRQNLSDLPHGIGSTALV